jgi:large subunit ribosomal protein L9
MPMQIILIQDVDNLGKAGELVSVKPGFGRNFLIPRGMAVTATTGNVKRLEHEKRVVEKRVAKERAGAQSIAERLNGITLQFERNVGEDDKLFGSVSNRDIADQLKRAGIEIDHRKIELEHPVKALGKYEVVVRLGSGVVANLKFWVVKKEK